MPPKPKEAKARLKINKLLEGAGWRLLDTESDLASVQVELNVKMTEKKQNELGDDFESTKNGYIDYLLLDDEESYLAVLEAKSEVKDPLDGKEQARRYAQEVNARFVILSNGNMHYFWDIKQGNPDLITEFPSQEALVERQSFDPNYKRLTEEEVDKGYIASTQRHDFKEDPSYLNEDTSQKFIEEHRLAILRPYQVDAVKALQRSAGAGNKRFLFEMATGTGKTLVSAAVIKLFLRTGNAKRVLFLVDRLELEKQASKSFTDYLKNDCTTVIYKENKDDWQKAQIVISTVQSLLSQNKYKKLFSPTHFDLVISDEAHRSISGNSRAVFEYFVGYKLGLTATPKDYIKNINAEVLSDKDQRFWERRQLLDTYKTFGCENSEPTFRYSLLDGVKGNYLINPCVVDARTKITTQLLSKKGFSMKVESEDGVEVEESRFKGDFEKKFFSEPTNEVFCKAIIEEALKDPISGEIGKTIVFCATQKHASKIAQILNRLADEKWPNKYNSNFAMQITSNIPNAQQMMVNFANNKLEGETGFLEGYKSSKTRVCVTVGMMTTGYDCQDILNLALLRPIFSPTDFVQIKGRGTRKYTFKYTDENKDVKTERKTRFKLFDFFANYEYFENDFNYDEEIDLPAFAAKFDKKDGDQPLNKSIDEIENFNPDKLEGIKTTEVGSEGMKVDRKLYEKAERLVQVDKEIKEAVENAQWDLAESIFCEKYEDKPELYLTLKKIQRSENLDRRITWREVLERIFGLIDKFPTREEKQGEEFKQFIMTNKPESSDVPILEDYFKTYIEDSKFRKIIDEKEYARLNNYAGFSTDDFKALGDWREKVPEYIKDYVPINQYMR